MKGYHLPHCEARESLMNFCSCHAERTINEMTEENNRLRAALEWYAKTDQGKLAREVLKTKA